MLSIRTVAIENLADPSDGCVGVTEPPRDEMPMGVVDRLSSRRSDVGADVHTIATRLRHDAIDLLPKEQAEVIQGIAIAGREVDRVILRDDEGVSIDHWEQILDGEVMHVLAARSRPTFLGSRDQSTESATRYRV